ncbi:cell envelope biogenesis protein OmpA [Vibrio navarrensis]|uniref:OmpA n=1 Tax=Vibrio navarrensis TaxID=29495 RepID=A0A099LSU0_9VIBR|nr:MULTISPECIES: OmpA family protein [Vibrio]KGK11298.1 ompA [Vibrio navarrensis]MBE3666056.1 cell envelope biogenesis protein OmpA [Vibrio navarrensis]MBE4578913.1 cell envelope biogenesis protein OmpA [Vibrio navarrensis]MBE4597584.1 cell envelope biogenesis protein OmpA [Vibrio navarrensis]MBE4609398.1 cell envelope biogenesis protein OmpA [Vibrio navarrensis]
MEKLFGSPPSRGEGGEHWMSVSDLMAGLMMVFLFISVALMRDAIVERDKIKDVAETYQQTQQAIYISLLEEFAKDLDKWGAEIDRDTLSVNFTAPEVLFANGKASLTDQFQRILNDFFPRYLEVLEQYKPIIQEIKIEGHTSSRWNHDSSDYEAYFNNMSLSQSRTRTVLGYVMRLSDVRAKHYGWVKNNVAAVGYSSSKAVVIEGVEDEKRSRRVSFRVITNAEEQILKILGAE